MTDGRGIIGLPLNTGAPTGGLQQRAIRRLLPASVPLSGLGGGGGKGGGKGAGSGGEVRGLARGGGGAPDP